MNNQTSQTENKNPFAKYNSTAQAPYICVGGLNDSMPWVQFAHSAYPDVNFNQMQACNGEIQRLSGNTMLLMLTGFSEGLIHIFRNDVRPVIPGTGEFSIVDAVRLVLGAITGNPFTEDPGDQGET